MFAISVLVYRQTGVFAVQNTTKIFSHTFKIIRKFLSFLHITYMTLNAPHSYSHIRMPMFLTCSSWTRLKFAFSIIKIQASSISQQDKILVRSILCSFSNFFYDFEQVPPYFLLLSSGIVLIHCISLYFEIFVWCCGKAGYYCNRVTSASI